MDRPHVLFVNRVFPPASGATGALLAELSPALVDRGWDVTVLTGPAPDAPPSEITNGGVRVERVNALAFSRDRTWKRALAYLSLYPALLTRALRLPSPDVVVTKTDPPLQLVLGALLKRITGARAVHWAQDLYPEIAEELDVIASDGVLAKTLRAVSTASLHRHDRVVAVGRCMKERLRGRGLPNERIEVVPNWPPASVRPVPHADNPFRNEHDLDRRFVVAYSGNMGLAHPFDAVLDAAADLEATHPDVLVLLIGDGPRKDDLMHQVTRRGLDNVRFLPFQPFDRLAHSLSAADLHLVTMQPNLTGLVVPSKLYGALAAGRPALFLGPADSEAARCLRENECGSVLPSPTGPGLADAIRTWHARDDERNAAGTRARAAVDTAQVDAFDAFDRLLRDVCDRTQPDASTPRPLSAAVPAHVNANVDAE